MKVDLLQLLQQKSSSFSKGQKRIAKFISESLEKAAFMTAAKLGGVVDVSESTVIRFANELGFEGYPQLQEAMQLYLMDSAKECGMRQADSLDQSDPLFPLYMDAKSIIETERRMDRTLFHNIVSEIGNAECIYILGSKENVVLADYLGYHLQILFKNVHIVTGYSADEFLTKTIHVGAKDLLIAFDFPAYSASLHRCVGKCRSAGARVIGITDSALAPLDPCCDFLLTVKGQSLVAPLSVANAIVDALSKDKETAK